MGNLVLLLHAAVGGWLGVRSPTGGLAVLVALVATTSGLYWQAGMDNLPSVEAYALALMLGAITAPLIRRHAGRHAAGDPELVYSLSRWVALLALVVATATAVAVVRAATHGAPAEAVPAPAALLQLLMYRPGGVAGQLRTAFVAILGPALLLLGTRGLRGEAQRRLVTHAFLAGLVLAVAAPAVQAMWFNPWARPDLGFLDASGISGLFHDPHSFASYLVLGTALAVGAALGHRRIGRPGRAAALLSLAAGAVVVLLFTGSRGGLLAMFVALLSVAALGLPGPTRQRRRDAPSWTRAAPAVALLLAFAAGGLLAASPAARGVVHEGLEGLAGLRMWEPLRTDEALLEMSSARVRLALWRKSWTLIEQRPLWGVGPNGFRRAAVPLRDRDGSLISDSDGMANVHNYFLQIATEYGVPALGAFVVIVVLALAAVWRAARRCSEPAEQGLLAGIFAGQVGFLVSSITSHPLLLAEMQALYWSLAALGVATAIYSPACQWRSSRSRAMSNPKYGSGGANGTAPLPEWIPPKPSST